MKKFLAIILSLATAVLASVGFVACGKNECPAKAPIVFDITNEEEKVDGKNRAEVYLSHSYADFLDYYCNNFNGQNMVLFYSDPLGKYDWAQLCIFKDTENDTLFIKETGTFLYDEPFCDTITSFFFDVYIQPIATYNENDLWCEYGELEDKDYYDYDCYINIYSGEECFATLYYQAYGTNEQIEKKYTNKWFETYLKDKLVWGDSL